MLQDIPPNCSRPYISSSKLSSMFRGQPCYLANDRHLRLSEDGKQRVTQGRWGIDRIISQYSQMSSYQVRNLLLCRHCVVEVVWSTPLLPIYAIGWTACDNHRESWQELLGREWYASYAVSSVANRLSSKAYWVVAASYISNTTTQPLRYCIGMHNTYSTLFWGAAKAHAPKKDARHPPPREALLYPE